MILFGRNKLDPILKLKLKEKKDGEVPVIFFLKAPLSNKLKNSISKKMGKLKYEYKFLSGASGQFSLEGIDKLSELPEIRFISYDRKANICANSIHDIYGIDASSPYNLTGKGTATAIIDTGVYPHIDLMRPYRVVTHFRDVINGISLPYDDNGHGTHICGIIAGSGSMPDGKFAGLAPGSKIVMLKAFNSVGEGSFSDILSCIDWVIENREKIGIKILCLPFGAQAIVQSSIDPLCTAVRAAWDAGIIVIAAAGNKGPALGSITTPGIEPSIITVGCCESTGKDIKNWRIPDFSGRGWRKGSMVKPELISPGVDIFSLSASKGYIPVPGGRSVPPPIDTPYVSETGSSVSAAIVSGCIALLLEKMPNISGKDLKGVLKLSCRTLNQSSTAQGYGVINVRKLLGEN